MNPAQQVFIDKKLSQLVMIAEHMNSYLQDGIKQPQLVEESQRMCSVAWEIYKELKLTATQGARV